MTDWYQSFATLRFITVISSFTTWTSLALYFMIFLHTRQHPVLNIFFQCSWTMWSHGVLVFPKLAVDTVKNPCLTCQRIDQNDWPLSQVARLLWGTERGQHIRGHGGFHRWRYWVLWAVRSAQRPLQHLEEGAGERLTDGLLHRCEWMWKNIKNN